MKKIGVEVLQQTPLEALEMGEGLQSPLEYRDGTVIFQCRRNQHRFTVEVNLQLRNILDTPPGKPRLYEGMLSVAIY